MENAEPRADIYNVETGEKIALGASYMPGVVIYEENSIVQVIIPVGLCRDDIVKSLKTITEAIESNGVTEGVVLAEVAIAMESDRMIILKTGLPVADSHEEYIAKEYHIGGPYRECKLCL